MIFAAGENGYVGKLLTVAAGQSLSLQYHTEKDETISIITGEATLEHGSSNGALHTRTMRRGRHRPPAPHVRHRITARTELVFVEASTAAPGWGEDIVRLADDYGRTGTKRA